MALTFVNLIFSLTNFVTNPKMFIIIYQSLLVNILCQGTPFEVSLIISNCACDYIYSQHELLFYPFEVISPITSLAAL